MDTDSPRIRRLGKPPLEGLSVEIGLNQELRHARKADTINGLKPPKKRATETSIHLNTVPGTLSLMVQELQRLSHFGGGTAQSSPAVPLAQPFFRWIQGKCSRRFDSPRRFPYRRRGRGESFYGAKW